MFGAAMAFEFCCATNFADCTRITKSLSTPAAVSVRPLWLCVRVSGLPKLANNLAQDLQPGLAAVVSLCGRWVLLRQVCAAGPNHLKMMVDDRKRAEIIPLPAAGNAVNKPLNRVCHFGSGPPNRPHLPVSYAACWNRELLE